MKTDWDRIRGMMNAAIDACARIEAAGYSETDRDAVTEIRGRKVSVHDLLISAWTYPETMRYRIIRDRHEHGANLAYVPESARILVAMAQASAELIDAGDTAPADAEIRQMIAWFESSLPDGIDGAIAARRKTAAGGDAQ